MLSLCSGLFYKVMFETCSPLVQAFILRKATKWQCTGEDASRNFRPLVIISTTSPLCWNKFANIRHYADFLKVFLVHSRVHCCPCCGANFAQKIANLTKLLLKRAGVPARPIFYVHSDAGTTCSYYVQCTIVIVAI